MKWLYNLDLKSLVKMRTINKIINCISEGIEKAILVSTIRVKGPEQVRVRDELALGYLYHGWRNASRQLDKVLMSGSFLDYTAISEINRGYREL